MRLGELLGTRVVDRDGRRVGRVHDARLVQDGPVLPAFGAALRVDGLVVGEVAVAVRLGYHRDRIRGPRLLRAIARVLERGARYACWEQIADIEPDRVTLACRAEDLLLLRDLR
jgi:hypothetical protein